MEKFPNQNNPQEGVENSNEFQITRKMEIQAELLGTNLEKLKQEINDAGGVEKFREMANKGLVSYKGDPRYYNNSKGEDILKNLDHKLWELRRYAAEKFAMGAGAVFAGLGVAGELQQPNEVVEGSLLFGSVMILGGAISLIKKKIEQRKVFLRAKEAEMKLDMSGSVNRVEIHDPKENKLRMKTTEELMKEKQDKSENIDKYL